ncbi:MAG: iron ABC transporter permease [Gammaproteobacteria bacterium]|nr:iron ABC transporter permease [Gammaproteobacteria bacterium]
MNGRYYGWLVGSMLALGAGFGASLLLGPITLPWSTLVHAATNKLDADAIILREVRLPRALLALVIGSGLGMAGAALQALLRNPLAEPGLIGISSGSALGAIVAFYSGLSAQFALGLPLGGLLGALAATLILYRLASERVGTTGLILAGVALNSLAGAAIVLALNLAPNPYAAYEIFFWLMGALTDRIFVHLVLAGPLIATGVGLLASVAPRLEALALGEDTASSLGVDLAQVRRRVILGTALAVGPGVAVAGAIGFVGLVVPHLLRPWVSHRPRLLLPASALGGGALLLAADTIARSVLLNGELKLGVITAFIGAPLFLRLALKLESDRR